MKQKWTRLLALVLAAAAAVGASALPEQVFVHDSDIRYAGSDYGRMQSAEAAYTNMFNTHRLYQVCGLYQTLGGLFTYTAYTGDIIRGITHQRLHVYE